MLGSPTVIELTRQRCGPGHPHMERRDFITFLVCGSGVAARGAREAYRQTGPRRKASMKRRAWCSQQSAAACMAAYARLRCRTMKAHADERAMCGGIPRACILASCLNNQAVLVLRAQPGAQSFARRRRARRAASADQARAGRRSFETISNFGFVLSVPD